MDQSITSIERIGRVVSGTTPVAQPGGYTQADITRFMIGGVVCTLGELLNVFGHEPELCTWAQHAGVGHSLCQYDVTRLEDAPPSARRCHMFHTTNQAYDMVLNCPMVRPGDTLLIAAERVVGVACDAPTAVSKEHGHLIPYPSDCTDEEHASDCGITAEDFKAARRAANLLGFF